jgi:hypothetical protein
MASKRQASLTKADKNADEMIACLQGIPGVVEIYSEAGRRGIVVIAFVESEEAEHAAATVELDMFSRDPDLGVELHLYSPTQEARAEYRALVPETLEWVREAPAK